MTVLESDSEVAHEIRARIAGDAARVAAAVAARAGVVHERRVVEEVDRIQHVEAAVPEAEVRRYGGEHGAESLSYLVDHVHRHDRVEESGGRGVDVPPRAQLEQRSRVEPHHLPRGRSMDEPDGLRLVDDL